MTISATVWAMGQHVPPGGKLVLIGLAENCVTDDGSEAVADMAYLAALTTYPVVRVQAILDKLVELGFITPEPRPRPNQRGPQYQLVGMAEYLAELYGGVS